MHSDRMSSCNRFSKLNSTKSTAALLFIAFAVQSYSISAYSQAREFGQQMYLEQQEARLQDCLKNPEATRKLLETKTGLAKLPENKLMIQKKGMEAANQALEKKIAQAQKLKAKLPSLDVKTYCQCRHNKIKSALSSAAPAGENSQSFMMRVIPIESQSEETCLDSLIQ